MYLSLRKLLFATTVVASGVIGSPVTAATVINPSQDVMTSAFFSGPDFVRGYAGDGRPTFRVASDNAFGVGPETVYLDFSGFDASQYTAPVASAIVTMTSVDGGFGANANASTPFTVSAHGVISNPFTSITDNTNPSGPVPWDTFFAGGILAADSNASTVINGFGQFEFDVTSLVNDWVTGSNQFEFIAMTGKNDVSTTDFLHGFANNTEAPGSTFLTVTAVPEPGSFALLGVTIACAVLRRRRRQ